MSAPGDLTGIPNLYSLSACYFDLTVFSILFLIHTDVFCVHVKNNFLIFVASLPKCVRVVHFCHYCLVICFVVGKTFQRLW
jgi:hypothetical protein